MKRFEYKTLYSKAMGINGGKINQKTLEKELNQLGAEGWELVSTVSSNQGTGYTKDIISILKRVL
jgi:hypothetical protein